MTHQEHSSETEAPPNQVQFAEWKSRSQTQLTWIGSIKDGFQGCPGWYTYFAVPLLLMLPIVEILVVPTHTTHVAWIVVMVILLRSDSILADRRYLRSLVRSQDPDTYLVNLNLYRGDIPYGNDLGTISFVDGFLYFEGRRTAFGFDRSVLKGVTEESDLAITLKRIASAELRLYFVGPGHGTHLEITAIRGKWESAMRTDEALRLKLKEFVAMPPRQSRISVLPPRERRSKEVDIPFSATLLGYLAQVILFRVCVGNSRLPVLDELIAAFILVSAARRAMLWRRHRTSSSVGAPLKPMESEAT